MKLRLLRHAFGLVLGLALLALPLDASWQDIGPVKASPPAENQIMFHGAGTIVSLTVLAPDLVRVRMARGTAFGPDYSYAVVKTDWPVPGPAGHATSEAPQFTQTATSVTIRTLKLEVRAQLSPFRLALYDRNGGLISKDDDDLGTAWDGARVRTWKWMPEDEHYFGLGEKAGPLDKRGRSYAMWNTDAYGWDASTDPLYQSIPFYIGLRQGRAYGVFFDNTYRSSFDMGAESPDRASFGAEGGEMNYYFFYGPDPKAVLGRYTELVGRTPLPARWMLGYHQCRYSYYPENMVRFIADNFRQRHIPCDAIFFDIHYMDGYRVFTWDKSRFPDPPKLLSDLRQEGFRAVPIIDPGIKIDPNYFAYQEGVKGDDFVKMPDGKPFVGAVWPGECNFPDFTQPRVREWWGSLYKGLLADGVAGIWNDMDEPAVFRYPSKTMPPDAIFWDQGLNSPHTKIHNVYGMLMSEGTRDGLLKLHPNERPLVITRATYAGGQRYAAVWTGDNTSTWDHLRISVQELMNMGLSGLTLAGADIGGFALSSTPELYTRWLEAGIFYPYCRTHTEYGSRDQEPWSYGNRITDINRKSIELRYHLLPYLYNAFHEASETGIPVMRALLLDYPDDATAVDQNQEFLFGDDLLVAPVLKDGEITWDVYLPRGEWYDYWTDQRTTGPKHVTVSAPLDRAPIFVRSGAIVPTQQVVQYTDQAPIDPLTFEIYPQGTHSPGSGQAQSPESGQTSSRQYYEDDGISFDYQRGVSLRETVTAQEEAHGFRIEVSAREGSYTPPARSLVFKVHAVRVQPGSVETDGRPLEFQKSLEELGQASDGWAYDAEKMVVWVKVPDRGVAVTAQIKDRQ
ncbi:MAG TPA: TIM-barrel domain-containing protein [Terriglobia bacterium]|nr:TIM-barrel domain-containing protein [Terriglobia bacterium]